MEAEPVVSEVRERFGLDIVVLRVLEGEVPFETPVTYLAELVSGDAAPLLTPWEKPLTDDPLRLPYAHPGGPDADLSWAARHVDDQRLARADPDVEPVVDLEDPH